MPIVAAAVCPHPPLLSARLAAGAAAELDQLRAACDTAVAGLIESGADLLVVVGGDATTRRLDPPYGGSFAPWGGGAPGPGGRGPGAPGDAPLSLLVGAWLLARQQMEPGTPSDADDLYTELTALAETVRMQAVAADAAAGACARLGGRIAAESERVALLAMGDGSARRGVKSPGYADPRAEQFDAEVAGALARADPDRLLAIDPRLAADQMAAGRAPWQVLAGAAGASHPWTGELHYAEAPYGVGYFVASWRPVRAVADAGNRAGRTDRP